MITIPVKFQVPPAYCLPGTRSDADDLIVDAAHVFDNPFAAAIDDVDVDYDAIGTQARARAKGRGTWLTTMDRRPARV